MMGNSFEVRGWAYCADIGWHFRELYLGESLLLALCVALRARRHYGCVKLEMRQ